MRWIRTIARKQYTKPMYNFTIDDSSPMIKYEPAGAWMDNVYGDPSLFKFYQMSYHYTTTIGASATLSFVGTGVSIMGSQSLTHDAFEIRIDNQTISGFSAYASDKQYQMILAAARNLRYGNHTIQVINRSNSTVSTVLDIDAFIIDGAVPQAPNNNNGNLTLPVITMDDATASNGTSSLSWSDGWATKSGGTNSLSDFMNSTVHESTKQGSSVTFNFVGEALQVIGGVGPNNTQYSVQIDGGYTYNMNANASDFLPSSTLFYTTNLDSGSHKVIITNTGSNGGALTIDSFQIVNSGAPAGANSQGAMKANVGLIAGVIIGTFVLIMLLIGGFLYWRQRQEESDGGSGPHDNSDNYSVNAPSYMERIKGVLTRSDSRASARTAVDPENGMSYRSDGDKEGYGASSKWWKNLKEMVTGKEEPESPRLPFQHQGPNGGVGDVPGSRNMPRRAGDDDAFVGGGEQQQPNAASVWMNGSRQLDQNRRFSNQSLEQEWDNRNGGGGSGHPYASNSRRGGGHSRNQSSPTVSVYPGRDREQRERRNSAGGYTISNYQRDELSPSGGGGDYPETPARPRYEIDLGTPAAPRRQNSDQQRDGRRRVDFR